MVEHLLHLLACHHFLHKAVDASQTLLLLPEVFLSSPAVVLDHQKHQHQKYHHNQRQPQAQHTEHGHGSHQGQKALNHQGKAVVQRLLHRIHIVGKPAHQLPVGMGVKISQRKLLDMGEQILADFLHHLLGGVHHQLVIPVSGCGPCPVHERHENQHPGQTCRVPRQDVIVDHRLHQVGAQNIGAAADKHQHRHHQQQPFVAAQIPQKLPQRFPGVFGPLIIHISRAGHYPITPSSREPFCWDS